MTERLLQFIWQFQYFDKKELTVSTGESLQVIQPGIFNCNQGPDFLDAKTRIGGTTWAGSVELHLQTSGWHKHRHGEDRNYDNVVLHVVWEDDETHLPGSAAAPVLELSGRVSKILLLRYEDLMKGSRFIPCERSIQSVHDLVWKSWKDRLLAERLLRKSLFVETCLRQNNFHWEETCWWMLARNFGIKVNAEAFESVARSIPLGILAKQKMQLVQLEALLAGQAGLLNNRFKEEYPRVLQREYRHLAKKYDLHPISIPVHFLRMRPVNFPGIRLAQLAALVRQSSHLFSKIKELGSPGEMRQWFGLSASEYWDSHYRFDEEAEFKKKTLGKDMIDNIVINSICPLLFAYGNYHGEQRYKDKALDWLEQTAPESNRITRGFRKAGVETGTAFDSQALLELKNSYCDHKRCLDCSAGNFLLKK